MDAQTITITAEPLNVERCKFVVGVPVYTGGLRRFTAPHEVHGSPLAEALFAIPGAEVQEVIVSGNLVTVVKASTLPWQVLGKQIGAAIREALAGPRPAIAPKEEAPAGGVDDDTLYERVARLFDEEVNPMVARQSRPSHSRNVLKRNRNAPRYLRASASICGHFAFAKAA